MDGINFQNENGTVILPLPSDNTGLHIIEGEWGKELVVPPNNKTLSNDAMSFILMKEKEIKEYEEEVSTAESNLKTIKSKLYSSKHCLESFKKNLDL